MKKLKELLAKIEPNKVNVYVVGTIDAEVPEKQVQLTGADLLPYLEENMGDTIEYIYNRDLDFSMDVDDMSTPEEVSTDRAIPEDVIDELDIDFEEEYINPSDIDEDEDEIDLSPLFMDEDEDE